MLQVGLNYQLWDLPVSESHAGEAADALQAQDDQGAAAQPTGEERGGPTPELAHAAEESRAAEPALEGSSTADLAELEDEGDAAEASSHSDGSFWEELHAASMDDEYNMDSVDARWQQGRFWPFGVRLATEPLMAESTAGSREVAAAASAASEEQAAVSGNEESGTGTSSTWQQPTPAWQQNGSKPCMRTQPNRNGTPEPAVARGKWPAAAEGGMPELSVPEEDDEFSFHAPPSLLRVSPGSLPHAADTST